MVKHTEFNKNSISFAAFSNGGSSLYKKEDIPSVPFDNSFIGEFGLGEFTNNELRKALTGKTVNVSLVNDHPYSMEDNYLFYMIAQLLNKQYITEIRKKEGGTYGVQVRPTMSELPNENIRLAMQFDCKPEDQEKLTSIIYREIELMKQGQVNTVSLEDIKKNMIKSRQEMILRNGFWMTGLKNHFQERDAYLMRDEYVDYIMGIDSEAIIRGANTMLNDAKTVEVVMKGTIVN